MRKIVYFTFENEQLDYLSTGKKKQRLQKTNDLVFHTSHNGKNSLSFIPSFLSVNNTKQFMPQIHTMIVGE